MTVSFDLALGLLVRVCESQDLPSLRSVVVVRDLRGRLRLVVEPEQSALSDRDHYESKLGDLHDHLTRELGSFYFGPVLNAASARPEEKRLALHLADQASEWSEARAEPDPATGAVPEIHLPWKKLERRLAKEAWLSTRSPSEPAWPLGQGPSVVTFFSFKGGVGRSTALASCAWQLAKAGSRVAVVDLDLEGPGVGSLLGVENDRGIIDFFADWAATGRAEIDGLSSPASALGASAEKVDVYPAGRLGLAYLEKLARLDFAASTTTDSSGAVDTGLRALLGKIRGRSNPDYILLDARSGLHDLAGLSLHGLSHVEVLFTRASEQGFAGLAVTLETLGRTRHPDELQLVVAHALAPAARDEIFERERQRVLERSYEQFCEFIYGEEPPGLEIEDGAHTPIVLQSNEALERFDRLSDVERLLLGDDYARLLDRIRLLCTVSEDE